MQSGPTAALWIDELLVKLHAIYGAKWERHIEHVPYPALRATWADALAGWTKADAKTALDYCAQNSPWPPSVPDFVAARNQGQTEEQRAAHARLIEADAERKRLPAGTWAEQRTAAAEHIDAARAVEPKVTRSVQNIERGRWTRDMENAIRADFGRLGMHYSEPEWPAQEEK